MSVFAQFAGELRKRRFRKNWDSRGGGCRVAGWSREEPDGRTLMLQLLDDGRHRISHAWCGCEDTRPTDFANVAEMDAAIERERTRTDSSYRNPANHHVPASRAFLEAAQSQKATD